MDPAVLQILIKLMADTTGATLTADEIQKVKLKLGEMGVSGEDAFQKVEGSSERFSFRSQHHAQMAVLGMMGLQGPLTSLAYHFEYLQMMADRSGMSVAAMLEQFAPMIGIVAVVGALGKAFMAVGAEGKSALDEAGRGAGNMFTNFEAGLRTIDLLNTKLEKTSDTAKRAGESIDGLGKKLQRELEYFKTTDELQRLELERKDIEERTTRAIGQREAAGKEIETQKATATSAAYRTTAEFDKEYQAASETPAGKAAMAVEGATAPDVIAAYYDDLLQKNHQAINDYRAKMAALLTDNAEQMKRIYATVADKEHQDAIDEDRKKQADLDRFHEETAKKDRESQIKAEESFGTIPKEGADIQRAALALRYAKTPAEEQAALADIARISREITGSPTAVRPAPESGEMQGPWLPSRRPTGTSTLITPDTASQQRFPLQIDPKDVTGAIHDFGREIINALDDVKGQVKSARNR